VWRTRRKVSKRSSAHYHAHKERARVLVHARLAYFNQFYGFALRKVFIKNMRSRWGSCSELGNLNFNYRLLFLPNDVVDYIIVHELCHLAHFNHSPQFWELVSVTIPEHKALRRMLRKIEKESGILQ
jgi:predicted metal-dependent hydrolase